MRILDKNTKPAVCRQTKAMLQTLEQYINIMKKILFFALVLAAGALAFTSCEKKDKIDSPIVGTWMRVAGESDFFYTFGEDGTYQRIEDYYMNGRDVVAHEHIVGDGTFKIDGDVIDATLNSILVYMDGSKDGDPFDEFWPMNEKLKFSLKGDYLTLIHNAGTEEEWPELLLKQ